MLERKDINQVDDETAILADLAGIAVGQVQDTVREILESNGMDRSEAIRVAKVLAGGK